MGLLEDADILVENNSPREMAEQGLDFPSLHKEHPHLIVTSITAFGQTGPYRDYLGDDLVAVNMGGLAYSTPGLPDSVEDPDSEPPLRPATYAGDFAAAISGAVATMLALFGKERSGVGRHVDVSVQEAVAATMIWDLAPTSYLGLVRRRGTRLGYGPMPNCYLPCKDGYVVLTAFSDEHWAKLVEIMGNPDWAESELFDSPTARADSWDGLRLLILEWTMAHTGQEISEATQFQGIPCFPAFDVGQALATEQIAARRYLRETDIGGGRAAQLPGLPFRFGDSPLPLRREAPALGQHTTEVLYERLGYGGPELERLRRLGVI
jgi:crotonobetainyl-CoA:carnitine CoA-transferase CaiB-like acyl-CoA transferase